ncbi:conserved hypothetical protein [Candidatus Sulfopaludibacter sp. SbA3]|nr:conserved hypothetical protein [Candidatus Sulfopaludibacter sp. SbA3]
MQTGGADQALISVMRKWSGMRFRFLAAFLAVCLVAMGQTMSVDKLMLFLRNAYSDRDRQYTDRQIAAFLAKVKLSDKLEDRTIEDLQSQFRIGPLTMAKLQALRDQSHALTEAKITREEKPKPIPPPSAEEQAAALDEVREYALSYSKNLPDFICTEVTRRYGALPPGTRGWGAPGDPPRWQSIDTVTKRLSYFDQKEEYKTILHNNTPMGDNTKSVGGSESFGDFGSMLRQIFEKATEARFEWDHWGTLRGQRMMEFAFHVRQERSQYSIVVDGNNRIIAAYHGTVAVDPTTHAVMRLIVEAENIPTGFPVKSTQDVLDYDYQDISGQTFLLPLKATMTANLGDFWSKNDKEFRIYRKYSADAVIKYDTNVDTPAPLDESKTKETAPPPPAKKK